MTASESDREAVTRALTELGRDQQWPNANAYLQRHAAEHATDADLLDELVLQQDFLPSADPDHLIPELWNVKGPTARRVTNAYRYAADAHRATADIQERAATIRRDLVRIARTPDIVRRTSDWDLQWTRSTDLHPAMAGILTGHTDKVNAVAFGHLESGPVAITGSDDRTVRVWDLSLSAQHGFAFRHAHAVFAVTFGELGDRSVAITGSDDQTARMWNINRSDELLRESISLPSPCRSVAFDNQGRLIVGCDSGEFLTYKYLDSLEQQ